MQIAHTMQPQMMHQSQQRIIMNVPKYSSEAKISANVTIPGNTFGTFQVCRFILVQFVRGCVFLHSHVYFDSFLRIQIEILISYF